SESLRRGPSVHVGLLTGWAPETPRDWARSGDRPPHLVSLARQTGALMAKSEWGAPFWCRLAFTSSRNGCPRRQFLLRDPAPTRRDRRRRLRLQPRAPSYAASAPRAQKRRAGRRARGAGAGTSVSRCGTRTACASTSLPTVRRTIDCRWSA